jgi:Tfp pilus assembly protein PilV
MTIKIKLSGLPRIAFRAKDRGQTLIEALITVLILGVGIIALIRFQNYLSYDTSLAQQKAAALIVADKKIESLMDFQVLNDTPGYTSYQSVATGSSTDTVGNTTYNLSWTITSNTNPTYKTVDLTVTWTDRRNATQSIRVVTRISGVEPSNSAVVM